MATVGFLGAGKLGLPCALVIESKGHWVFVSDHDIRITEILRSKEYPHLEKGLYSLLLESKISNVTTDRLVAECSIIFVAIQTPHAPEFEGVTEIPSVRADFSYEWLKAGVTSLSMAARRQSKRVMVLIISTCLPGTIRRDVIRCGSKSSADSSIT